MFALESKLLNPFFMYARYEKVVMKMFSIYIFHTCSAKRIYKLQFKNDGASKIYKPGHLPLLPYHMLKKRF